MAKGNTKELAQFDNGVSPTIVTGTGGSPRHGGYFSKQNPYLDDMSMGRTNQDIDASYERAVEWEADYANLQEQRAYDRAVLEEQREYDSPLARLQRDKSAGINSELAGGAGSAGSAGGSSAQLAQREIDDQQAQTKFSNSYDNLDKVFSGINTASNLVTSIAGAGSTVVGAIDTLSTLPARRSLAETSSDVASRSADSVVSLAKGEATAQHLANMNSTIGFIENIDSLFSAESSDEDISTFLQGAGVPEAQIKPYIGMLRQSYNNPSYKTWAEGKKKEYQELRAHNEVYTPTLLLEMEQYTQKITRAEQVFAHNMSMLRERISSGLNTKQMSDQVVSNAIEAGSIEGQNLELYKKQVSQDLKVFAQQLTDVKTEYDRCESVKKAIMDKANSAFGRKISNSSELKGALKAQYEAVSIYQQSLNALGSKQLREVYDIADEVQKVAFATGFTSPHGDIDASFMYNRNQGFQRYMWSDVITGKADSEQLTNSLIKECFDSVPFVGPVISSLIP